MHALSRRARSFSTTWAAAAAWLGGPGAAPCRRRAAPRACFRRGAAGAAAAAPPPWALAALVNLDAFPLHDPASVQAQAVVADCQQRMREDGYCVLRRFLRPQAAEAAAAEVRAREDACFVQTRRVNMWGENPQQHGHMPPASLRRMAAPDMYGVVAKDELDTGGALRMLYTSAAFAQFAAHISGCERLHVLRDDLAGCTGEILREGQARAWQFAPSPLLALAMLQRPQTGGVVLLFRNVQQLLEQEASSAEAVITEGIEDGHSSVALEALRTVLQAAEIESGAAEMGMALSWRQIMEDMDTDAGAVYHKHGPFSVQTPDLDVGDVLLLRGGCSIMRTSQVLQERPLITSSMQFYSTNDVQVPSNERKRLFGRKRSGVAPPLSSTYKHFLSPLARGAGVEGGAAAKSQYTVVMSERDGDVQEIEADEELLQLLERINSGQADRYEELELNLKELFALEEEEAARKGKKP